MTVPLLPDDLQQLVMADWYDALWLRMHKGKFFQVLGHLTLCFKTTTALDLWEEEWGDENGVVEQPAELTEQDCDELDCVSWKQVMTMHMVFANKGLGYWDEWRLETLLQQVAFAKSLMQDGWQ